MVINTNTSAQLSAQLLSQSSTNLSKSLARLSSGSKITSPADDAAGLAVSMKFDAQINRINAASNNVGNATSYTQTQDGYLQKVSTALNRMSELSVLSQDVTKTDTDRGLYNQEFTQMASYITDIGTKDFNGVSLFSSTAKAVTTDSDAHTWSMGAIDLGATAYTDAASGGQNISTTGAAVTALSKVKTAIDTLASNRATVGANMARLNYTNDQLSVLKTNLSSANSRIKDVDVAEESTQYARYNILVQSGTAMLAQANTAPQAALRLLG